MPDPLTVLTVLFGGLGTGLLAILYQQVREYRGMRGMFEGYMARVDGYMARQQDVSERVARVLERLEARGSA